MITITKETDIRITGLPLKHKNFLKKYLSIENPAYHKILRITGGNRWAAQSHFKYYKDDGDVLVVPKGLRKRLLKWMDSCKLEYEFSEKFVDTKMEAQLLLTKQLRPYQKDIIEKAVVEREGIIKAGTGTGKTVIGLEIIARLGLKATILVPNSVLLGQFYEEAVSFYGYKPGRVGNGKKEATGDVVISTWQSLSADSAMAHRIASRTAVLIVDEANGIVSPERMKILSIFKPKHLFGLSATPMRSKDDGRTEAIKFLLGDIIVDYENTLMTPTVEVVRTGAEIMVSHNYNDIIDDMVHNQDRNKLIVGLVTMELLEGRKVLVLTKRIEHYKILQTVLPENNKFFFIESEDKERNELLRKLKNGEQEFSAVFGTVSLLAVGSDIPSVETIIICSDLKSNVLTIQMAGRILRLFEGKQEPKIIDLYDEKNPILKRQFYERKKVYESKRWTVSF